MVITKAVKNVVEIFDSHPSSQFKYNGGNSWKSVKGFGGVVNLVKQLKKHNDFIIFKIDTITGGVYFTVENVKGKLKTTNRTQLEA